MPPVFSVIVPAYNSENHIADCLKSVLNQNFSHKEYEIIIVNDCSQDKTLKICKKFKKKNEHIKIYNNKINRGVSYTRNSGINKALGQYAIFLDSDDMLSKNSLKEIKKLVYKNGVDLVLALNLKNEKKNTYIEKFIKTHNYLNTISTKTLFSFLNANLNFKAHCWNYIININFIKKNDIYFKNSRVFEDQIFTSQVLFLVKKIKLYRDSFHKHTERFDSLSRSMKFSTLKSSLIIVNDMCEMLKDNSLAFQQKRFLYVRINFMIRLCKIHLLNCNKRQIKKVNYYIKKNIDNFSRIEDKFIKKINYNLIKKNIDHLIIKSAYGKFTSIYIFGVGELGRAVCSMFKKKNIVVKAILDNNKNFYNKKYSSVNIINPKLLSKLDTEKLKETLVIISADDKKISNHIYKQLRVFGLKSSNLRILNWKKILQ